MNLTSAYPLLNTPPLPVGFLEDERARFTEYLHKKQPASSGDFREINSSFISHEIPLYMKESMQRNPHAFLPSPDSAGSFELSASYRPENDSYLLRYGKTEDSAGETVRNAFDFPNDAVLRIQEIRHPYPVTVDIREPLLAPYPLPMYELFGELVSTGHEFLLDQCQLLSSKNALAEILLSILGRDSDIRFRLKDLHFILFVDGVGSYLPTRLSLKNDLSRWGRTSGTQTALAYAAEMSSIILSRSSSFCPVSPDEGVRTMGIPIGDATKKYRDIGIYPEIEHSVFGERVCSYEIFTVGRISLYVAYRRPTVVHKDIQALFAPHQEEIMRMVLYFTGSEAFRSFESDAKYAKSQFDSGATHTYTQASSAAESRPSVSNSIVSIDKLEEKYRVSFRHSDPVSNFYFLLFRLAKQTASTQTA